MATGTGLSKRKLLRNSWAVSASGKSPSWPELELGYWIVEAQQGTGYAFEAGQRCLNFARDDLEAASLVSYIDPTNESSQRHAEKLGATYEETIQLGEYGPHGVYRYF